MEELGDEFSVMVKAFMQLGAGRIETLGYDRRKIEAALGCDAENRLLTSEKMQQAVYGRFHTDDIVPANEVNTFMRQLISDNGIPFNSRVDRKIIGIDSSSWRTASREEQGPLSSDGRSSSFRD